MYDVTVTCLLIGALCFQKISMMQRRLPVRPLVIRGRRFRRRTQLVRLALRFRSPFGVSTKSKCLKHCYARKCVCRVLLTLIITAHVIDTIETLGVLNAYGSEGPRSKNAISRGKRTRHKGDFTIITANMNCGNSVLPFLARSTADVVMNQETKFASESFWDMKRRFLNGSYRNKDNDKGEDMCDPKWRAEGSPANIITDDGKSAGVLTFTRPSYRIYPIPLPDPLCDPRHKRNPFDIYPGHVTGMIMQGSEGRDLLLINVYMDCHSKFGTKNRAILYSIGMIVNALKIPYVIMGDWQLTPQELASIGWLNTIDGYVIATEEVTCLMKNRNTEGSIIDYAVVSGWIAPRVKYIRVTDDAEFAPHKYVEMRITFKGMRIQELRANKTKGFPEERPVGPPNRNRWGDNSVNEHSEMHLDDHADWVMARIEENLVQVFHLPHEVDTVGRSPYTGRARGLVLNTVTDAKDDKPCPWRATADLDSMKKVRETLSQTRMLIRPCSAM